MSSAGEVGAVPDRGTEDMGEGGSAVAPGGIQEGAARLLAHMAFRDDMRDAIASAGAVPALVALLQEGEPDAQVRPPLSFCSPPFFSHPPRL